MDFRGDTKAVRFNVHLHAVFAVNGQSPDSPSFLKEVNLLVEPREFAVFFFSSRRRHTRCSRDWSSDVCSSDLLKFCRADGATLVSESSSPGSEAGTARLGSASQSNEIETSILPPKTDAGISRADRKSVV